jgi:hypothetical protein
MSYVVRSQAVVSAGSWLPTTGAVVRMADGAGQFGAGTALGLMPWP